jgi:5-(carboxyamino)imidazole ribonucleotide synthase
VTDQFENHCRATLGLPLGGVYPKPGFAMLNLLGPDGSRWENGRDVLPEPGLRTHVHWYSKTEIRPNRKVGHLNGAVESLKEMGSLLAELDRCHQEWLLRLANAKERTYDE